MAIDDDLLKISQQEAELQFDAFNAETAWTLGSLLRKMSAERGLAVVIDIQLNAMPVFYCAFDGTTPDNPSWVRRKRNVVLRLFKSSYAVGLSLKKQATNLDEKLALPNADYAAHGGCFPIVVKGTGCVGAVTVSGLPQRDDHDLVVEALATLLGKDITALKLSDA